METSKEESASKKHNRHGSSGRSAQMPRRSTRGPLDLSQAPVTTTPAPTMSDSQILSPSRTSSIKSPNLPSRPMLSPQLSTTKDFSKLLRPEIYHPLPALDIPAPFLASSPSPQDLPTLLSRNNFRAAAILAAQTLTTGVSPSNHVTIFTLFYIRLACLTLCNSTALAAQEVKVLEDLNSSIYHDDLTGTHLVPWELRVLAVRLQGMGFSDPRKGVMGYYDLARDARNQISKTKALIKMAPVLDPLSAPAHDLAFWEHRLEELGIRVADALVEMKDVEGAAAHLETLRVRDSGDSGLAVKKALLWLRLGDVKAARACVSGDVDKDAVLEALGAMADGLYMDAAAMWGQLVERDGGNEMYAQNEAVCLLYSGRMDEARSILEGLVDTGKSFHALTFNLSTIYELCTDKSRALKLGLAEKVASLPDSQRTGWEKTNLDFKL